MDKLLIRAVAEQTGEAIDDIYNAIARGERHHALHLQGLLLGLGEVVLPHGTTIWTASKVAVSSSLPDGWNGFRRLNAAHFNFGTLSNVTLRSYREKEGRRLAGRVVGELGYYGLIDNNNKGSVSWRTPDGDLHATTMDTRRPHTPQTGAVIIALETAGYTDSRDAPVPIEVPTPFSPNNPDWNTLVWWRKNNPNLPLPV